MPSWLIDGQAQDDSLFGMIRASYQASPAGILSAYSDNAAVLEGCPVRRFFPRPDDHAYTRTCRAGAPGRQGRDAQSPHRHFAVSGCGHRLRRRDSRRGGDRLRRQAQGRPVRVFGVEPAHPRFRAALGNRPWQAGAHRRGAGHHDRGAAGRGRLQQRIRPPQPVRLLPHLRGTGARSQRSRTARLPQADHAGRRLSA